jgi:hypothetical protein
MTDGSAFWVSVLTVFGSQMRVDEVLRRDGRAVRELRVLVQLEREHRCIGVRRPAVGRGREDLRRVERIDTGQRVEQGLLDFRALGLLRVVRVDVGRLADVEGHRAALLHVRPRGGTGRRRRTARHARDARKERENDEQRDGCSHAIRHEKPLSSAVLPVGILHSRAAGRPVGSGIPS